MNKPRDWLTRIREAEQLNKTLLAKKLDLGMSIIGKYESGKRNPHPDTAKKIAKVLNFKKYGAHWKDFFEDEPSTA